MKQAIRYSKKRAAILTLLQSTTAHPSAEWLFQRLKPEYPDLSLGTIYRNLTFFQEQGTVKSIGVVDGQERFDGNTSPHCHFICECCGRVIDLHALQVEGMVSAQVGEEYGFSVVRYELNLYGSCDLCLKEQEELRAKSQSLLTPV